MWRRCCRERELRARVIQIGQLMHEKFPTNVIRNQKYNIVTFLPLVRIRYILLNIYKIKILNDFIF